MLTIHGGRTRRLWPELLKAVAAARQQNIRCLLLVPEQYTLQAEEDILSNDLKDIADIVLQMTTDLRAKE